MKSADLMTRFAETLSTLQGSTCIGVTSLDFTDIELRFRKHLAIDSSVEAIERQLRIHCTWRLEDQARVIVGSGSVHLKQPIQIESKNPELALDDEFQENIRIVLHLVVERADVNLPSYMVTIQFSHGLCLWIFPDWTLDSAVPVDEQDAPWLCV